MVDLRPVLFVNGLLLMVLAAAMGIPALVDFVMDDLDWLVFLASGMVTGFSGVTLTLANRPAGRLELSNRQAFLLTASSWILAAGFSALPFTFSNLGMSFIDGYFEAMSGLTTTGATVITGLDTAPHGILLWRAVLHGLGGIGIIVMAVAILPVLRIGGMQLFRLESSDKTDKVRPRISQTATAICFIYVLLLVLGTVALWLAGMTLFEAVCHSVAAVSTGGFSTSDASLAHFHDDIMEWILVVLMTLGGCTFVLFINPWKHGRWQIFTDSQIRWYIGLLGFFLALVAFWLWAINDMDAYEAVRYSTFTVVTIVTTTGFASTDYTLWGGFPQMVVFILTFIGGCTGSTSGAIKIFRFEVLFAMAGVHLKRLLHPHGVFVIDFNHRRLSDAVVRSVVGFVILYFFVFSFLTLALTMTGVDVVTALSGAASALGNVGPGLGDIIGPSGTYKPLPDAAKVILSVGMLLGRLEILTVIVLFLPSFWRD